MEIYLVGGAVRDEQLGLPINERDWCIVGSSASELVTKGFKSVGKNFPIFLHPRTKEEYALARTEQKTHPGYHGFKFNTSKNITLEEDLKRRDLTINAMAKDANGLIIDPYNGLSDIKNRILKHVSEAFNEDPVRVLRTAKFAARYHQHGFKVAEKTMVFMESMVKNNEIDELAPDRVWKETEEVLNNPNPHIYFRVLKQCNALSRIYPEFTKTKDSSNAQKNPDESEINLDALELSVEITNQAEVHFVVMLFTDHDLCSTNYTQKKHYNVIQNLTKRLPIPNTYSQLAELIIYYKDYKNIRHIDAEKILSFLDKTDAFRRKERFKKLLMVFEIIERNDKSSPQDQKIKNLLINTIIDSFNALPIKNIVGKESNGEKIKKLIHQSKIEIIKKTPK